MFNGTLYSVNNSQPETVQGNENVTFPHGVSLSKATIAEITIPLYSLIFLLSITGNSLVIIILTVNRSMKTVTNIFLLNLAVSDLLLGIVCMPVNLTGQLLKAFIFGPVLCKIIPYLQSVSVSVGVWTLVGISMERYFAICKPLTSRRWQTRSHANKIIIGIWIITLLFNIPTCIVSRLVPLKNSARYKCREEWSSISSELIYNVFLNAVLLMIPLLIMSCTYTLIALKLWRGMKQERWLVKKGYILGKEHWELIPQKWKRFSSRSSPKQIATKQNSAKAKNDFSSCSLCELKSPPSADTGKNDGASSVYVKKTKYPKKEFRATIRTSNTERSIQAKKKVIQMLFVIVLEFFICWTPLHVMNFLFIFKPRATAHTLGTTSITLIQLLAYVSSCCNPITYCLMHQKFRSAFLETMRCKKLLRCHGSVSASFAVNEVSNANAR